MKGEERRIKRGNGSSVAFGDLGEMAIDLLVRQPREPRLGGGHHAHLDVGRLEVLSQHRLQRIDGHLTTHAMMMEEEKEVSIMMPIEDGGEWNVL